MITITLSDDDMDTVVIALQNAPIPWVKTHHVLLQIQEQARLQALEAAAQGAGATPAPPSGAGG